MDLKNSAIELIHPIGSDPSPYLDTLNERGKDTHHLAYVVPSIEQHSEAARGGRRLFVAVAGRQPTGRRA